MRLNRTEVRSYWIWRNSTALLFCGALLCTAAPVAQAKSAALWIVDDGNERVDEYLSSQLKHSHKPTPITISISASPRGLCFDKSNNLWVTDLDEQILGFTASALKKLPKAPAPAVTITSSSFGFIISCTFDQQGDLWLTDYDSESLDEVSSAQLAGSGSITPSVIITSSGVPLSGADYLTFDASGNLWADGDTQGKLFEFSASDLTSGGAKAAAVILEGGGSLSGVGELAFDSDGNLWVTSQEDNTVVMFSKSQLSASNDDAPAVTISSSALDQPAELTFNSGDLWVLDHVVGNAQKFVPKQLESSGAPAPKVLLKDAASADNLQITFGPAYGK